MPTRKLAAALAVAASLAVAPAAFAGPAEPHPAEPAPPSNTYPSFIELMRECNMLREQALLARDWGNVEMYLEVRSAYDRLNCDRWTGPLPAWIP